MNGVAVEDGSGCGENNEIRLLFNADRSGELAKDCGNGAGEEPEEPTPTVSCPENTSEEGQGGLAKDCGNGVGKEPKEPTPTVNCPEDTSEEGQGGLATTLTDTATGAVLNCYCIEVDTKYTNGTCETLPASCTSNADCNRGDYCEITSLGGNKCTRDTRGMRGNCRNAHNDIQAPKAGKNPPFVMSNRNMMWWTANHFCQALGKTLVDVSDYQCAHTICASGCSAINGYCHETTSTSVGTPDANNRAKRVEEMALAYGGYLGWTNTDYNSCRIYHMDFPSGGTHTGNNRLHLDYYSVCK